MASTLPIVTTGAGTQNATQDPQTAGSSAGAGTPTSSVQPGSIGSLDATTGGVPLGGSRVSTVSLPTRSSTVVKPDIPRAQSHPLTTGLSAVIFLLALGLLLATFIPTKNTTD